MKDGERLGREPPLRALSVARKSQAVDRWIGGNAGAQILAMKSASAKSASVEWLDVWRAPFRLNQEMDLHRR